VDHRQGAGGRSGARIGEVLKLDDPASGHILDVANALWIKPVSSTKQKKLHVLPSQKEALALALELLEVGVPDYESCKRAWKRARKATPIWWRRTWSI
jgi:hypothetical protein